MLVSCQTSKKTTYLQDAAEGSTHKREIKQGVRFQPNDMLSIIVSCRRPEMAAPFNLPFVTTYAGTSTLLASEAQTTLGYLVDMEGNIEFPVFGKIKVAGFTRTQLAEELKQRLIREDRVPDPIVTVEIMNFQVSVLGEVMAPGTFTVAGDRITLLQALGKAGDLTIYGKRSDVLVQREANGIAAYHRVDLRSVDLIHSPVYYLQQNDVVYVGATNARAAQSKINENRSLGMWLSLTSLLISLSVIVLSK
jgi:polysaccharide export outer membrane protein